MDTRLKELQRRVDATPGDVEAARALASALGRRGDLAAARATLARALDGGAPGDALVDALRAAEVPLRALPSGERHALVGVFDDVARVVAALPFEADMRVWHDDRLVVGTVGRASTHALRLTDGLPH